MDGPRLDQGWTRGSRWQRGVGGLLGCCQEERACRTFSGYIFQAGVQREVLTDRCLEPMSEGTCSDFVLLWYFHTRTGESLFRSSLIRFAGNINKQPHNCHHILIHVTKF
uniref:Uncharacterized protein n=1 Tax=Acanthochromis polyacanthus TaxID=80966 RepID=A0A3Q1FM65_9TELE